MVPAMDVPESRSHDETAKLSFEEFRAIPTDEAEEAAKFLLYETFAKACEVIRGQVFAFYDDNKANLGPRVCAAMTKTLADIDRTENLGTVDDESTWFVLGMARQVDANATMMMNVLADFGRRLELLGAADQSCPVCLDAFEPEVRSPLPLHVVISMALNQYALAPKRSEWLRAHRCTRVPASPRSPVG